MLEVNDTTVPSSGDDEGGEQQRRGNRPRRSATRAAGPPAALANPFLPAAPSPEPSQGSAPAAAAARTTAVFQAPQLPAAPARQDRDDAADGAGPERGEDGEQPRRRNRKRGKGSPGQQAGDRQQGGAAEQDAGEGQAPDERSDAGKQDRSGPKQAEGDATPSAAQEEPPSGAPAADETAEADAPSATKKRRRRRRGSAADTETDASDPNTVTKVRAPKEAEPSDRVTGVKGSTRLEAKKQRRREGREAGRRRAPILSEAEFLARRESVDRAMVVRRREDVTQIAVMEDGVLVEHYVTRDTGGSATMVGNVYLGRVQNVLPSMEAAFVDIGRGRNAVLYAGEVNWDAAGLDGQPRRIEFALKSGDPVLVQVTKDPIGHKGARLTSQVSLPGRYLVYVPDGSMTGISRKLPDTERSRLRGILKRIVPEDVGVIVRTAAEGASEDELTRDVTRLSNTWQEIQRKAKSASPPHLLHAEPDLAIRVVRDIFNEDFKSLQVSGDKAWRHIKSYVDSVAPDLAPRTSQWTGKTDVFAHFRIDEQLAKALDRKVWLPSGGSLIIEATEAMTVIDVNTGKFTGQGGDLEETVTQNNLEAAEEIVRQVRLRDIGGIIVIDFIDMVLESNRDLVLRRLVECLGRDRTKHQVTEITSLGLAQMTRKRIGGGLLETFSETCDACSGRGIRVQMDSHGAPANGRRKPARPTGAHDPVEAMQRHQHDAEVPAQPQADDEVELPEPGAEAPDDVEFVAASDGSSTPSEDAQELATAPEVLQVGAAASERRDDAAPPLVQDPRVADGPEGAATGAAAQPDPVSAQADPAPGVLGAPAPQVEPVVLAQAGPVAVEGSLPDEDHAPGPEPMAGAEPAPQVLPPADPEPAQQAGESRGQAWEPHI